MDATGRAQRPYLFSDIGCYTLSALPPYNAIDTCVDMGASISMALGAAKAGAHPVICSIGDSTFIHSGMTGLIGAAHENANMTVFILDNAVVGMTGGQEVFATGDRLVEIVKGLGVDERHLVVFEPLKKTHEQTVECIRREIDYPGLSVIIARRPCIHFKRREAASERGNTVAVSRAPQPT
jgi:indolepyruvate ferredoxin oxidoreductase alpha subunit